MRHVKNGTVLYIGPLVTYTVNGIHWNKPQDTMREKQGDFSSLLSQTGLCVCTFLQ